MSGRALLAGLSSMAICVAMGQQQATAQSGMAGHAMEVRDEVPPETLPPPQKLSGIANVSLNITATPEAQMWFEPHDVLWRPLVGLVSGFVIELSSTVFGGS